MGSWEPFLLKLNGCFLESMTVLDQEFPARGGGMDWRRGKRRWAGAWAICKDLCRPLQPCDSNIFTVLAELRKCGLTDSETCLKSVTLSLGGGQTVSVTGRAEGSSGRGRSWGGGGDGKTMFIWPVTRIHTLDSECIHYVWILLGTTLTWDIAGVCASWPQERGLKHLYPVQSHCSFFFFLYISFCFYIT